MRSTTSPTSTSSCWTASVCDRVDLIGCSIGGWIAAEIATKAPERVRRLVLVGPVGVKTGPTDQLDIPDIFAMPQSALERLLFHDPRAHAGGSRGSLRRTARRSRRATARRSRCCPGSRTCTIPKLPHRLHRVTAPTLFLRGESDGLVSADYLAAYARLLPDARIATRSPPPAMRRMSSSPRRSPRRVLAFLDTGLGAPRGGSRVMKAWHFSENAYPYLPPADEYESIRVSLPNRIYDPEKGAALYDRFLDEWLIAEDEGMEIMLNEHHQTATCVDPAAPLVLAALARLTKKARLLILGNPIANRRQPVRVAEEMAMVDMLSRGRLEAGFVRGVPYEVLPANSNPVRMNERQWEALDLIVKAWTSHDGPFSHEGRFFHYRAVNIWPRPYQQPHPPIWISTTSPGGAARVGAHGYVQATFLTGFDGTRAIFDAYRRGWREAGHGPGRAGRPAGLCGDGLCRAERGRGPRRRREAAVVHHRRTRCRRTSPTRRAMSRCRPTWRCCAAPSIR